MVKKGIHLGIQTVLPNLENSHVRSYDLAHCAEGSRVFGYQPLLSVQRRIFGVDFWSGSVLSRRTNAID